MINPRMVTLAREALGMTQAALAQAIGVSQATISQIEHGLDEPSERQIELLSETLLVPKEFFFQSGEPVGEGIVDFFHRKRRTLPAKPLNRAHALVNIIRGEVLRLLGTVELSDAAPVPVFSSDDYEPAEAALMVRRTWRVPAGPISNIVGLIEASGIPIVLCDLFHEKLSAMSVPGQDGRSIIVLNEMMAPSHLRFALAHELGHLVMHSGSFSPDMEKEADRFASEFLMPESDIARQLRDIRFRDLGALKHQWSTSLAALARRAFDLGGITERQYRYFNMQLNQLPDGRKREPGERPLDQPRLIRSVIDYFSSRLRYSITDVAKVMVTTEPALRSRYLGETPAPQLRALKPSSQSNIYQLSVPKP